MATKHNLSTNDIKVVKEKIKDERIEKDKLTKKETEIVKDLMAELKAPVEFTDEDFGLGEGEIDIRKLSDANWKQMMFRQQCLTNIYLRSLSQSMTDLTRLLMVVIKYQGSVDVVKDLEDIIVELQKRVSERK